MSLRRITRRIPSYADIRWRSACLIASRSLLLPAEVDDARGLLTQFAHHRLGKACHAADHPIFPGGVLVELPEEAKAVPMPRSEEDAVHSVP